MVHGLQGIAHPFAKQRQVEMCVGVMRVELQRPPVMLPRLRQAALFVVEIAEIELGEGIAGVRLDGFAVVSLGVGELALAIVDGAQVDQGARGARDSAPVPSGTPRSPPPRARRSLPVPGPFETRLRIPASGWRCACAPGRSCTPPSSAASKSNRIWPVRASIFCPATCTAIFRPSETMRSSRERLLHPAQPLPQRFEGAADLPALGCGSRAA